MTKQDKETLSPPERRAAVGLSCVYAVRMLGLFMIMPVFAIYADDLTGVTPFLVGLAIGIYGLTQAILQVPLGMLSDQVGRKPVIVVGLLVFALGSAVAALSTTIEGVIIGRAIQGSGAIAAAVMALAADLTREENRTKVMAVIGLSIGLAFSLALVAGPILHEWIGVQGIFWTSAALALAAIAIVVGLVPSPFATRLRRDTGVAGSAIREVGRDLELLRLDFGVFVLHAVLTANFVVIPGMMRNQLGLPVIHHWWIYLPVLLVSFTLMLPFIILGERRRIIKSVVVGAVALLAFSELSLAYTGSSVWTLTLSMLAFFGAFNLLEASLPSLVAKRSPPDKKGTAMGMFSTGQFLGAFAGGALGGALMSVGGAGAVFWGGAVAIATWWIVVATMQPPRYLSSYLIKVGVVDERQVDLLVSRLSGITGVAEAVVIPGDGVAYLKVDKRVLNEGALQEFAHAAA